MRGSDTTTGSLFSYVDVERRVPARHPLRTIRALVNEALAALDAEFATLYAAGGRPSIAEEAFGWAKTIGGLGRMKLKGTSRMGFAFTFAMAAYNLILLPKLIGTATA
jgi:hypothetical protein